MIVLVLHRSRALLAVRFLHDQIHQRDKMEKSQYFRFPHLDAWTKDEDWTPKGSLKPYLQSEETKCRTNWI